ncbi:DNA double-strand break repair nuclease NurA [bacterium]|nr:DNA double-strand break repair nuclease NurA [bacterium]
MCKNTPGCKRYKRMVDWLPVQKDIEKYIETQKNVYQKMNQESALFLDLLNRETPLDWEQLKATGLNQYKELLPDFIGNEPITTKKVNPNPTPAVICTTDGSQVFPSHHEISSAALINISRIRIDYSDLQREPLIESRAKLIQPNEPYENSEFTITDYFNFREYVSTERTHKELLDLFELMQDELGAQTKCVLCLVDGSLIQWGLIESKETKGAGKTYKEYAREHYVETLKKFEESKSPVAGYISGSGSREVIKWFQLAAQRLGEEIPDEEIKNRSRPYMTDVALYKSFLKEGERSTVFHSNWLKDEYDSGVSYFFLHVGSEVARIELLRCFAENESIVDFVAEQCYTQARLGGGYPVLLSEAHEQAVVRGPDRAVFYSLIEQSMLDAGLPPRLTNKEMLKRNPVT